MRGIEARLRKVEAKLNIDREFQIIIIADYTAHDFIKAGYFKDKGEQDLFLEWRMDLLRKENKNNLNPLAIYLFSEEDVKKNIAKFQSINCKKR